MNSINWSMHKYTEKPIKINSKDLMLLRNNAIADINFEMPMYLHCMYCIPVQYENIKNYRQGVVADCISRTNQPEVFFFSYTYIILPINYMVQHIAILLKMTKKYNFSVD